MTYTLEQPAELTVSELFTSGQYTIPIYQRNYTWGKGEIEQLLQDLMDEASLKQEHQKDYYLGSLVVHQRKDGKFEIIDGQQRHTTLCILMAVLKNEYGEDGISQGINLAFEHRYLSSDTLELLFDKGLKNHTQNMESAMVAAYKIAQTYLENSDNQKVQIKVFAEYLANHAKLLRVIVPEDTDLNHYFEIMNSRGEQLEKHEVLKARLMEKLKLEEQDAFAKIWDACADMSRYVQLGFSASKTIPENDADGEKISERVAVFGSNWNQCPENFDALVKSVSSKTDSGEGTTFLKDILKSPKFKDKKDTVIEEGKYGSVINFPNFLLQVLSVLYPEHPVTLDDKTLLDSFEKHPKYKENLAKFAKNFIMALLQMRFLFDNWVVKSTSDGEHWRLRIIKPANKSSYSFVNSVQNEADEKINNQLIMMLSMRHVSFPSQNYKQWLSEALSYLYKNKGAIDGVKYLAHLEDLSDQFFKDKYADDSVLHKGTGVLHFFFNRLDYLLWKMIEINKKIPSVGDDKTINIETLANSFRFTFRNSIEHHYAQNLDKSKISCDSFGNLCLITHQSNSRLSDRSPHDKRLHKSDNSSLKQAIVMSYDSAWGQGYEDNMVKHQNEMIELLKASQQ